MITDSAQIDRTDTSRSFHSWWQSLKHINLNNFVPTSKLLLCSAMLKQQISFDCVFLNNSNMTNQNSKNLGWLELNSRALNFLLETFDIHVKLRSLCNILCKFSNNKQTAVFQAALEVCEMLHSNPDLTLLITFSSPLEACQWLSGQ